MYSIEFILMAGQTGTWHAAARPIITCLCRDLLRGLAVFIATHGATTLSPPQDQRPFPLFTRFQYGDGG